MRHYLDEFIEPEEKRHWNPPFREMVDEILQYHNDGKSIDEIARTIEEEYYIFRDEEDHPWNMEVVENVINKQPIKNRFTGYIYNF